mmetsp:Transcript_146846/g.258806  ORF Transcript_146846/g.258806 Transcript_146846/m.258806 type:complete len:271 (+) Transcript_146846:205-1017(+)
MPMGLGPYIAFNPGGKVGPCSGGGPKTRTGASGGSTEPAGQPAARAAAAAASEYAGKSKGAGTKEANHCGELASTLMPKFSGGPAPAVGKGGNGVGLQFVTAATLFGPPQGTPYEFALVSHIDALPCTCEPGSGPRFPIPYGGIVPTPSTTHGPQIVFICSSRVLYFVHMHFVKALEPLAKHSSAVTLPETSVQADTFEITCWCAHFIAHFLTFFPPKTALLGTQGILTSPHLHGRHRFLLSVSNHMHCSPFAKHCCRETSGPAEHPVSR